MYNLFSENCVSGDDKSDSNKPLTEEELEAIITLSPYLVCEMKFDISRALQVAGCISVEHMTAITKKKKEEEANRKLLDILKKRSSAQYKQFVQCLRETGQLDIVKRIERHQGK